MATLATAVEELATATRQTVNELEFIAEHGPIRLACDVCDRGDCDGILLLPTDWQDIREVRPLPATFASPNPLDWYTHIGMCPNCADKEPTVLEGN